ncbi:MAG TPA: hypothetical protein VGC35_06520 [Allosphingosinicella sp.]|jgi:hypothetical protein
MSKYWQLRSLPLIVAAAATLTGCAGAFSTREAAVGYNRAFADARNEVLLLNVLRTWAREPMQFSTIASVNGGVRTGAEFSLPFTNIILGGEDSISPSLKVNPRNPAVTINPLGSKEFMQGMSRPASVDLIDSLVTQGWDRPTVLALTIGGVSCPVPNGTAEKVKMNFGEDIAEDARFWNVFSNSMQFSAELEDAAEVTSLRMNSKDAAEFLTRGAGEGRKIASVKAVAGNEADVIVKVVGSGTSNVKGLSFTSICNDERASGNEGIGVIPRSPQGMIRYLAELHRQRIRSELDACDRPVERRNDDNPILFRVRVTCAGVPIPIDAAVATSFQGRNYYIPRAAEAGGGDRTLHALSLLTEFIALQTTEASIASSRPIIAVTQ